MSIFDPENNEWLLMDQIIGMEWAADAAIQAGVQVTHFSDEVAAKLFSVIHDRRLDGRPVNVSDFEDDEFADLTIPQLDRLTEKLEAVRYEVASGVDAAHLATKVIASGSRRLHNVSARTMLEDIERGTDWTEAESHHQKRVDELSAAHGKQFKTFVESESDLINEVDNPTAAAYGVPSGFHELDSILGGLMGGKLIVPAAVSGGGKSAFTVCVGNNIAKTGGLVGFVSCEMKLRELHQRIACCEASVDSMKIRAGRLDQDEKARYKAAVQAATKLPFLVVDDNRNLDAIIPRFRTMHRKRPFSLLVCDYTQLLKLVTDRGASREQKVAEVAAVLKSLAMELEVPVISPSQLNKEAERRDGSPQINDLRESAAIGHTADVVLFITPPKDGNTAEVYVAKNRGGPKDKKVMLTWRPEFTRFENHSFNYFPES